MVEQTITEQKIYVSVDDYMEHYAHLHYEWVDGELIKMFEETIPTTEQKSYVSVDDYMEHYAHDHYEWVDGELIKIMPGSLLHQNMIAFLLQFFNAYFAFNKIGQVIFESFVMRLDAFPNRRREPDLQVILNTNPGQLTETYMHGAADICIEIVSPESIERDYDDKLKEYEAGGVREYWIFDPNRKSVQFHRLNESGTYTHIRPDAEGNYQTPLLPNFSLNVPTLWADPLPNFVQIYEIVKAMFAG